MAFLNPHRHPLEALSDRTLDPTASLSDFTGLCCVRSLDLLSLRETGRGCFLDCAWPGYLRMFRKIRIIPRRRAAFLFAQLLHNLVFSSAVSATCSLLHRSTSLFCRCSSGRDWRTTLPTRLPRQVTVSVTYYRSYAICACMFGECVNCKVAWLLSAVMSHVPHIATEAVHSANSCKPMDCCGGEVFQYVSPSLSALAAVRNLLATLLKDHGMR